MKKLKVAMLGAGSGFVLGIAKELMEYELFDNCEFVIMDIAEDRLKVAKDTVSEILKKGKTSIKLTATTSMEKALDGANHVITSCEQNRYANWVKDLRIPAKHGVHQIKGENGGPGGMIHAIRNIALFEDILSGINKYCPDAWLMNFTNPMSVLCTYFKNYSKIKALGFCHQVHGSFGVISEMLGMNPGDIQVLAGGINHLSWLFDIRKRNSGKSCMDEFLQKVRCSKYWTKNFKMIPEQKFTLEMLNIFNMYPIGYDDHIIEYLSCFWEEHEWKDNGYKSLDGSYEKLANQKSYSLENQHLLGKEYEKPPFPKDPNHQHYVEKPCQMIMALETNTPTYIDGINIVNNGAISNLPSDAILDLPAVAIAGEVRSIHVGELPLGPMEICRRQVTLHEMIAKAAHDGDDSLAIQTLCLDPYVRSITQAKNIWDDFREEYANSLPKSFQ